jgi:REP element-mobilizing transposase RayT
MTFDPERRHRRSIRLQEYDYAQAGAYFLTICARDRGCLFADIHTGAAQLTAIGEVVTSCWEAIPEHFSLAELDAYVVKPNHLHGIVVLGGDPGTDTPVVAEEGTACRALLSARLGPLPPGRIASLWQANYHEHIIRGARSLDHLRAYIAANPLRWAEDSLHPENPSSPLGRSQHHRRL